MTKFTFANRNIIVVEGYKIGDALPARAPSLLTAAQIAACEISKGTTPDSSVSDVKINGDFKDVTFENGALLTVPAEYDVKGYKHALEIVVSEISD